MLTQRLSGQEQGESDERLKLVRRRRGEAAEHLRESTLPRLQDRRRCSTPSTSGDPALRHRWVAIAARAGRTFHSVTKVILW